jgi:putative acetyltransferase
MTIGPAAQSDIESITTLFRETILTINVMDYSSEQTAIWASAADHHEKWQQRIKEHYFIVAPVDGIMAGFGSLTPAGHLDLLYVHRNFQRRGIAKKLYQALEEQAIRQQNVIITAEVSITARTFFEKVGFGLIAPQTAERQGILLVNYRMEKRLIP